MYRAIHERRDVRSQFLSDPLPDEVLARLLTAAHHAPSVGFMQPWRFVVIRDAKVRKRIHGLYLDANQDAAASYGEADGARAAYKKLKLAGILDAPVNLCIVCDSNTDRGRGLGRATMPETAAYSTVCAVQNLWLAARSEGVGVGWVSILHPERLRETLGIPESVLPVAYLCLGYVSHFEEQPELASKDWEQRADLAELIHFEAFGESDPERARALLGD